MASISDIIEKFILDNLGESDEIDISRNELANFFSCAPSQINYVLETRFTVDRGLCDAALNSPFSVKDHVRAQIFKSVLVFLLSQKEGE